MDKCRRGLRGEHPPIGGLCTWHGARAVEVGGRPTVSQPFPITWRGKMNLKLAYNSLGRSHPIRSSSIADALYGLLNSAGKQPVSNYLLNSTVMKGHRRIA